MQIFLSTQNVKNNNVNFKNTKKQVVKSTLKNINYNNKTKLTIVQYFSLLKEGFSFRDIAGFYSYNENELEQVLKNAKEEFYRASGLSRELLYSEKNQRKFYTDTKFFVVKDNDYVCEDDLWCYAGSRNFNKKRKRIEKYQFHNLIREFKDLSQMKKELGIKDVKNLVQEINKYPDLVDDYTQMLILKNHIINFLRSPAKLQKLNSNIDINDNNVNESLKIESTRSEKDLGIEESGKDDMRIFFNGDGSYVEIPSKTITKEIIKEYTFHLRKGFRKFIVKSPEEIENLIETYKSLAEICAAANIKNPKSFLFTSSAMT